MSSWNQAPFSGAPPIPNGFNIAPNLWQAGQWMPNPRFNWNSFMSSAASHLPQSWAPSAAWGRVSGHNGTGVAAGQNAAAQAQAQAARAAQAASRNPYKRVPKEPSAEYFAQLLSDNPLGLTNMVPREQLYGPGKDGALPETPWIWNPRNLDDEDTDEEESQPTFSPRIIRTPDYYRNTYPGAGGNMSRSDSMPSIESTMSGMGQMSMTSNSSTPSRRSSTSSSAPPSRQSSTSSPWPSVLASASSYKYSSYLTRTSMKPEANSRRADQIRSGSGEKPRCLINVDSLELTEFGKADFVPSYAILSHRWGRKDEEVGYHEFKRPTVETHRKVGYQKIVAPCQQALLHGYSYLWVDTCCINQDDKDDVHRNIKSMFSYYQHSSVCLAYLADVDGRFLRDSVWFTRGWTLQELLAPQDVEFFNCKWINVGSRLGRSREISLITGIPEDVVKGETHIHEVDVEEKMSWSAHRETSRPPDQAYCLFGILGVSVEPDYEEDVQTAFSRLCEAWFKKFAEQSGRRKVMVPNMTRLYRSLRYRVRKEAWNYRDCKRIGLD